MSRDFLVFGKGYWHLWVEARVAATRPTVHGMALRQTYLAPNANNAKGDRPCFKSAQ